MIFIRWQYTVCDLIIFRELCLILFDYLRAKEKSNEPPPKKMIFFINWSSLVN